MLKTLKNLFYILGKSDTRKITFLIPLFIVTAILETLSIGLIVPLISVISDDSAIREFLSPFVYFDDFSSTAIVIMVLVLFIAIYILKSFYAVYFLFFTEKFLLKLRLKLHNKIFQSYLEADYEFHLKHNRSELKRNVEEVGNVFQGYLSPLIVLIVELMILLSIFLMLYIAEPFATLSAISFIALISISTLYFIKPKLNKIGEERLVASEKITKHIFQGLGAIKEVKVLQKEPYFASKFNTYFAKFLKVNLLNQVYSTGSVIFVEAVFVMSSVGLIYFIFQFSNSAATLPLLALFAMSSVRMLQSVKKINMSFNQLSYAKSGVDLVKSELSIIYSKEDNKQAKIEDFQNIKFLDKVTLNQINFSYHGSQNLTLSNVNIEFNKNTCTAIIGPSGSGKTTLVNIFLNLLKIDDGDFIVDQTKYDDLFILKNSIGYVPQSVYIIDDTVAKNIAFGVSENDINYSRIDNCLKLACLYEFVSELPEGVQSILGEDGSRLSGGQRQRLGIARALYNDPDIIVFDEMTASLDGQTEFQIMKEIFNMAKIKTIIIITHKINTTKYCDNIYFIEKGNIEAHGTYEELYNSNKKFKKLADTSVHDLYE
jgi:ATP-binding cassette, subfamily B, bacterial PglK